ncbi:hypothetical protein BX616_008026 [Lobosporangium transversale]|uniref:Uncharacterized protein n=1 Tax=Lobosporangium transversale TaxID=64571 RepID=A0A1Y2GCP1_9FUNG|nr:hypothetical protein BCR41DRAFT_361931 [Lobosporangium transversale]KAF9914561.1 hypothetical protein BX616_008026 [Lobosporangium transversale]ORZ05350.1 hypothetical protein BCR41DRAFT_361931 [Lobosporangium transversale]|eukprot:XP_021877042.1 hypothetical protein BCR41DRAFT_361931 [Lobosporangium transversale]
MIVTSIVLSAVSSAALMMSILTAGPFLPKHMDSLDGLAEKTPPSYLRLNKRRKRRLAVDEAVEMEKYYRGAV